MTSQLRPKVGITTGVPALSTVADAALSRLSRPLDELLATIDVENRASHRRVRHQVDGERRDVGRTNHASDRQNRTQLRA